MVSSTPVHWALLSPSDSGHWKHKDGRKAVHCGRFSQRLWEDQPCHAEAHAAALQGDVCGWRHRLDEVWLARASAGHQPWGRFLWSSSWWVDLLNFFYPPPPPPIAYLVTKLGGGGVILELCTYVLTCPEDIFSTAQHFVTTFGVVVQHRKPASGISWDMFETGVTPVR